MSGRFPESDSVSEFEKNLFGGVDMVTSDGRRWKPGCAKSQKYISRVSRFVNNNCFCLGLHGLPHRNGKLKNLDKFDASFFGVAPKQADNMDPQLRMLLEVTHEAIVDAGS